VYLMSGASALTHRPTSLYHKCGSASLASRDPCQQPPRSIGPAPSRHEWRTCDSQGFVPTRTVPSRRRTSAIREPLPSASVQGQQLGINTSRRL
jgi:hypothetical protein